MIHALGMLLDLRKARKSRNIRRAWITQFCTVGKPFGILSIIVRAISFQVPCVGVSIGIERIFAILEAKIKVSTCFLVEFSLDV